MACGKPSASCPSANPNSYGYCVDPNDPSLPQRTYNVVAGDAASCNQGIANSGIDTKVTCSPGGGCGEFCGMPGPNCTSANPQHWGACLMGPAIPPWLLKH